MSPRAAFLLALSEWTIDMTLEDFLNQVRDAWRRLGTPDAISWASLWVVAFMFTSGAFGANVLAARGREWTFALICAVSVVALAIGLFVFRWLIIRIPRESLRPWATLVSFELTNVIRSWVFDELFVAFNFGDEHRLVYRILTGQTSGVLALILVGVLVPYARAFTRVNRVLSDAVHELAQLQADATLKFDELLETLTARVRRTLSTGLEPLTGLVAEEDARTLRHAIDDVVRPLSHQLAWETSAVDRAELNDLTSRISWRNIVASTLGSNPVRPLPVLIWVAFIVIQVATIFELDNGWLAALVSVATNTVLLYTTRWVWPRRPNRDQPNLIIRAVVLTLLYITVGLVCSVAIQFILHFNWIGLGNWTHAIAQSTVVGWAFSLIAGSNELYAVTNQKLTTTLDTLRYQVATINGTSRRLQQDVSRIVHGPIQDAIVVALRRAESLAPGEQLSPDYVQAVRNQIDEALATLVRDAAAGEMAASAASIGTMLSDLKDMWSDNVAITVTLTPDDEALINMDVTSAAILFEIVREATANAIRHGDAHTIDVVISCAPAQRVMHVTVSNDGEPLPASPVHGLGSRTMSELTVEWRRTQVEDAVVVEATIPLGVNEMRP